ncbi:MAG TPA: hypothetical protein VGO47_05000 [Chlamydiales bacterium]|nr:hypothetical protein [Chlamydiales bacterium]
MLSDLDLGVDWQHQVQVGASLVASETDVLFEGLRDFPWRVLRTDMRIDNQEKCIGCSIHHRVFISFVKSNAALPKLGLALRPKTLEITHVRGVQNSWSA